MCNTTLRKQFPALYNIAHHKSDTLAKVMATSPPDVSFRRSLFGPRQTSWNVLLQRLASVHLTQGSDEFRWNLKENDKFSVDYMYKAFIQPDVPVDNNNNKIWNMKIPLKTKVFAWYLRRGIILIKDNLAKRNWRECKKYVFSHHDESIKHIFLLVQFC